ncbi:MAG: hypothetical protein N2445_03440 [Acidobacteria bacterium]|nr:hypothetical protein [Acidobacteriota bacterium]
MKYTLDLTMEKLLHALQELIIFRRKFEDETVDNEITELAILGDIIVDLAEGIGNYVSHPNPKEFAKEASSCRFAWEIAQLFKKEGFHQFLCPPYFSNKDLEKLSQ